jgi:hypothetical protein
MSRDDDLRIRPGRVRDRGRGSAHRAKPFIARALAAAEKAGGLPRRSGRRSRCAAFGRGRAASIAAAQLMTGRTRNIAVKARIVRHWARGSPLRTHLAYLRREGVTKDGAPGRMFDTGHEDADHRAFAERCEGDRHHFRFIVSPQDAEQLSDLKVFTRDLMAQAEQDLGPRLDWVGIDHWNTDNPHIDVIVRGKATTSSLPASISATDCAPERRIWVRSNLGREAISRSVAIWTLRSTPIGGPGSIVRLPARRGSIMAS